MRLRPPNLQRRNRRRFVFLVIAIALFAVIMGALLAYLIFVDEPKKRPTVMGPPPPPKPVQKFDDRPIEPWDPEPTPELPDRPRPRPVGKPRPQTLDDDAIRSGLARLQINFNQCARDHGAVDDSLVRVGFSASAEGQVQGAFALAPHARTPLGRCIVDVLSRARLRKTELGRGDVRWSIILHP
jgi:hypothetical protein